MQATTASTVPQRWRWIVLLVIAAAQLMTALDATIVNIALPSAQQALGFSDAERQWVVTGYTLCFAGLLLLGGRLSDAFGRRRMFQVGLLGFGVASLLAGAAPSLPVLIAGRAAQGVFAALIAPTALSLLAVTFTEPKQRGRAFAVYGAVASSGAAAGLLLGGVLTEYLDWRWCLFVNTAVAAVVFLTGRRVLPDPPQFRAGGVDVRSTVLATGGLAAVVLGCSRAAEDGWTSVVATGGLVVGALALGGFVLRQARVPAPLLPLRLFGDRGRGGAYLAVAVAVVGVFGMFLMLTYYLQGVLDYSPTLAGVAVLPLALANALSGYQLGNRLMPRVAPGLLIASGLLTAACGLAVMSRLGADGNYFSVILPAEVLVGTGLGAIFPPAFQLAVRGVAPRDAGVASALANVATQVGSSIGTAVLNTIAVTATAGYAAAHPHTAPPHTAALVHGYATVAASSAGLLAAAALLVLVVVNAPRPQPTQEAS